MTPCFVAGAERVKYPSFNEIKDTLAQCKLIELTIPKEWADLNGHMNIW